MKILLLSDTYSEHTEKWALALAKKGHHIGLFSFNKASYEWHDHANITVFYEPPQKINAESTLTKLSYLKYVGILKKVVKHFEPDVLHAHYATSYGLLGALSKFHPFVLSVWGSDVYDFPKRSRVHRKVFQYNLNRADLVLSTSNVMREEIAKYTGKEVIVTPFGVDTDVFCPGKVNGKDAALLHVGTIKSMEEKYGIVSIIEAAEKLIAEGKRAYRFYLVGDGSEIENYRQLIIDKKLEHHFVITGRIPFAEVSRYHRLLDVFLNVSIDNSESFGVATVEAMASETPVIVTDVGGLMEVVGQGKFGTVIPKNDATALAAAIEEIGANMQVYKERAKTARVHVMEHYNWENNLELMIAQYESVILASKTKLKSKKSKEKK